MFTFRFYVPRNSNDTWPWREEREVAADVPATLLQVHEGLLASRGLFPNFVRDFQDEVLELWAGGSDPFHPEDLLAWAQGWRAALKDRDSALLPPAGLAQWPDSILRYTLDELLKVECFAEQAITAQKKVQFLPE